MPRLLLPAGPALFLLLAACQPPAGLETEAEATLAHHAPRRCPDCGWIESKRPVVSSVADPGSLGTYEYTVRMADGSSRIFRETLPTSWRVGERLAVMDGTGPPPAAAD
jgi:hypothetical protein